MKGEGKWSEAKLAYTAAERAKIMACIQRLNAREAKMLEVCVLRTTHGDLPRPHQRAQIREWYHQRWSYLLGEYEKILPHVSNLPEERVETMVKRILYEGDHAAARNLPLR